jgi:uncharacterized RDD family membrane protein YckC
MTEWYYADAQRERHGPVDAAVIREKFRQGELDLASLVWREGMQQWQPLSAATEELQLVTAQPAEPGIDLRADYSAIENGTAPLPAVVTEAAAATGTYSPYAAPGSITHDPSNVVGGGHIVHAGFLRRFAASIIDSVVTGVVSYALLIPLALLMGVSLISLAQSELAGAGALVTFYILNYAISILVPAIYFGWMQSSSNMASLGKMSVGAKVVRSNGERLGFWRAFLRYIAMVALAVVTCGIAMVVSAIMVGVTERKQGLHDMICDTVVVDKWAFTDQPERQQQGVGTVTIVVLSLFGLMLAGVVVLAIVVASIGASGYN